MPELNNRIAAEKKPTPRRPHPTPQTPPRFEPFPPEILAESTKISQNCDVYELCINLFPLVCVYLRDTSKTRLVKKMC